MFSSLWNRAKVEAPQPTDKPKNKIEEPGHVEKASTASAMFRSITSPRIPLITEKEAAHIQTLSPDEREAYLVARSQASQG